MNRKTKRSFQAAVEIKRNYVRWLHSGMLLSLTKLVDGGQSAFFSLFLLHFLLCQQKISLNLHFN